MLLAVFLFLRERFTFLQFRRDFLYVAASGAVPRKTDMSGHCKFYDCAVRDISCEWRYSADGRQRLGTVLRGMSAAMHAAMVICTKKADRIGGLENSVWQLTFSFLSVVVVMECTGNDFSFEIAAENWLPILILGVFNTGICCYLYFSPIWYLPIQTVSICGYLEPLSTVVFSVLLLGEVMLLVQMFGAVLILGGALAGEKYAHTKRANMNRQIRKNGCQVTLHR